MLSGGTHVNRQKLQKKKQREERIRKQKHFDSIRSLYPQFCFLNEKVCDKEYVDLVKAAVKNIDFQRFVFDSEYNDLYHEFLKNIVKFGFKVAFFMAADIVEFAQKIARMNPKSGALYLCGDTPDVDSFNKKAKLFASQHEDMLIQIGDNILFSKDVHGVFKYWPTQGFRICFVNDRICFVFQRIHTVKHNNNLLYEYMIPKTVKWHKKEYNLFFTNHAIERMIKRFSNRGSSSYCSYILLYEFFNNMKYKFDYRAGGRQFIQFYFPVFNLLADTVSDILLKNKYIPSIQGHVLSEEEKKDVYIKCFSSPAVFEDDNLMAITALLPGYHPTPESQAYADPGFENMKLKDKIRHLYFSEVDIASDDYIEAFKFFHQSGIQQVFLEKAEKITNPFRIKNYFDNEKLVYDNLQKDKK